MSTERDFEGGGIQLHSSTFTDHHPLPRKCSKEGQNVPPDLEWEGVPDDTAEVAVVCEDPDAPGGSFLHWLVSGIDKSQTHIGPGHLPAGARESRNDFGEVGWGGPMPPVGDTAHHYFFRVYASRKPLKLSRNSTLSDLRKSLKGAALAHGTLIGVYQR